MKKGLSHKTNDNPLSHKANDNIILILITKNKHKNKK